VEAIETAVESKFLKEELKQDKLKAVTKKTIQPVEAPPRRRRRKKGKTSGSETAAPATRDRKRRKVDQQEVAATIKQTMAQMAGVGQHRKRYVRSATTDKGVEESAKLLVTEFLTTQDLANLFEVPVQQLIKRCLEMGMLISINQRLERDLIELLAADLNIELEFTTETEVDEEEEVSLGEYIAKRPPVVTVMGHVDHGKTTLLDTLRKTSVAESEVGGITQHIGAYEVIYNEDRITFLDTPGHEAFTAMRARGVRATDIVVLVVAADDKVMPQTVEAIDHAKAAGVPIVIAVNKIDKPGANAEAIYKQLADNNILVEKWGGKYQAAEISAKFNKGIAELLAEILVAADILELKADPTVTARGIVIESRLDRGLGAVATILVQNGTLHIGDPFVVGQHYGRVRSMFDERGEPRLEAGPSTPVQLVGFNGVPQAGDKLMVQHSEKEARDISLLRQRQYREMSIHQIKVLSLDQVNKQMRENELRKVRLIIKGDVHGSVEVLSDALMKLSTSEVKVEIIHHGVGGIIESDVLLASASRAIVIGFHVHPNPQAREVARREGVEIRLYKLIHEVVDDIKRALEGLLAPEREERYLGSLEVRQIFKISRQGNVAGCYVNDGKITRRSLVKVIRDDVALWSGQLSSLKRFKDDAREVTEGFECGLMFDGFNDVHPGDRVEAYEVIELARKLEDSV
jgi:translation initiation factor IF-2